MAAQGSTTSDYQRAIAVFGALCPSSATFSFTTIAGAPPSKARHRFGRGRTYKTQRDTTNEQWTAVHLKKLAKKPLEGNIAIGCVFFRPNKQRIDVDNMLKHVLDSANGILWADDCQVTGLIGLVEHDAANPRTLVVIGSHTSTMQRAQLEKKTCPRCGTEFETKTARRYCTQACAAKSRGRDLDVLVPCAGCSTPFRRRSSYQKYCSKPCVVAARRGAAKGTKQDAKCGDCGAPVSKPEYKRCRPCWKMARATHGVKYA